MQETSAIYKKLFAGAHRVQVRVTIGGIDFGEDTLMSVRTTRQVFGNDRPEVGCCVAGEIDIEMIKPAAELPRMAEIIPYVRLTDGVEHSEWIQKGVYYIDTRSSNNDDSGLEILTLHGYDAMLKAEQLFGGGFFKWPAADLAVAEAAAGKMGVAIEAETKAALNKGYEVQIPDGYTYREILGYIAAMYAGNFVMSDLGELKLIQLNALPEDTNYLIDHAGYAITFGGVRILV